MSDKTTTIPTPIAGPKQFTPQTPTPNPQAPGSIATIVQYSIYNEKNEPVDLPVTYFNLFKAIYSTELMDVMATLGNPMYIAGGVAQYYIEQRGKTRNYTQGTALPFSATVRTDSLSCN
ncbi:hypothetical protein HNY73_011580 [Argiope bruennichi]|uniref:Uncharacterized protein n=1 Tax=Argiope bruennichi TaxID=94029 RepID=A0A8T0F046_ARGBR|nr:hypothetical protein HNY73_011580 [Argiope bruennichi]